MVPLLRLQSQYSASPLERSKVHQDFPLPRIQTSDVDILMESNRNIYLDITLDKNINNRLSEKIVISSYLLPR